MIELVGYMEDVMDWPMFRRGERQARRMKDMIARLGVDTGRLARLRLGDAYTGARAQCLLCPNVGECLEWLDSTPHEGERPLFCPNLALFESCRRSRLN